MIWTTDDKSKGYKVLKETKPGEKVNISYKDKEEVKEANIKYINYVSFLNS